MRRRWLRELAVRAGTAGTRTWAVPARRADKAEQATSGPRSETAEEVGKAAVAEMAVTARVALEDHRLDSCTAGQSPLR